MVYKYRQINNSNLTYDTHAKYYLLLNHAGCTAAEGVGRPQCRRKTGQKGGSIRRGNVGSFPYQRDGVSIPVDRGGVDSTYLWCMWAIVPPEIFHVWVQMPSRQHAQEYLCRDSFPKNGGALKSGASVVVVFCNGAWFPSHPTACGV
jgi:hypothetical protein